ncbi:TPA: sugar transferase [Morganella morganii subsp. morganii]|uniref:sugar transferase n=2 Tax=Morganella morganii TaxID=582 RepID=UPI00055B0F8F|nr:sugar transferase [Morganella morganii]HDS6887463.1 sugar transferase [Morganella morganii subsp. morganii]EKW8487234.1 sugar transferase [Morganella morganii]ELO7538579.1 sugar transferase [Morganella morganii]MBN4018931.1 sugar transferase [Morganella morganii]MBO8065902.1 sugar transferase [Morganella morganii]
MINEFIKRTFDIIFSLIGIIICSPVFIIVPILIKIDSPGPVFFKQARIGKDGKIFYIYKFRSMVVNAENMENGLFNTKDDPRITRLGNFLRNSSLDEVPQFINIMKGDMSFVGPRPPVTYELGSYDSWNEELKKSFSVKPGVTGLAQVSGRNELNWDQKTVFNLRYIENQKKYGLLYDIKIILLTIYKVIKNEGSHELEDNVEQDRKRINKD